MISRPDVGSVIDVEVIDPFCTGRIPAGPESVRYRGKVVKSHNWLTDQEFCMTGDDRWPVRVINLKLVRDISYSSGSSTAVDASVKTWEVKGSRGDRYLVTRDQQGYSCDCKGFQFRRNCRHVQEAMTQ